jgi:hypothetical protein
MSNTEFPQTETYYVGDLGYVLGDNEEVWDEVVSLMFPALEGPEVTGQLKLRDGRVFVTYGTKYGDGTYYDQNLRAYPVDSGGIGAIKVSDLDHETVAQVIEQGLGHFHNFTADVSRLSHGYEDGAIHFGDIVIDTGDYEVEEPDEQPW